MSKPDALTATDCNCLALRQATRAVTQFYDRRLAPSGLRTTQYSILHRLQRFGTLSINDLAAMLVMDASTLTHNLKPLLASRFVQRRAADGDKRSRVIELTPKGREVHREARKRWQRAQAEFESLVGGKEAAALRESLAAVVRSEAALADGA